MDPLLILFGFGVGLLVGMTGMGGGSLMTPLLVLFFGVKPTLAVGTDIADAVVEPIENPHVRSPSAPTAG